MWCSPFCSHVIGCCMSSSSDTQLLHYYYSTTQQKLQKWCVVLLKFFPSLFLPYDKYIQRVKWYCSLSLVKWQSVGAHRYLLDNTLLYGLVMQPPRLCLVQGPVQRCVEHLCICFMLTTVYFMLSVVAAWLLNTAVFAHENTHRVYTRKEQQLSVTADFWDVGTALIPLCVTELQGCMVLSLPGGMSLGRESVLQALTQTRSLSRVSSRNQIVKTCPYHFSIGCLTKKSKWNWEAGSIPCLTF